MQTNGKTKIIMFLLSCLFTIVVCIAIPALANNMIMNDRRNQDERALIRKEMREADDKIENKIDKIQSVVTDIRLEQRSLASFIKGKL